VLSLATLTWTYSTAAPWGVSLRGADMARSALSSTPRAWRVRRRSGAAAASMKDGAIGRGRGAMSAEQFEQAQKQIEENKAAPSKTPEEARRNSRVVGVGEIAPSQPTQADAAFLRTKAHSVRGPLVATSPDDSPKKSKFSSKQLAEAALRGKVFVPKSEMSAADVALLKQRREMARQVLSRNAPPTEEGVVYVPDWNENDAGKTIRQTPGTTAIGKEPEKEDIESAGGMRVLKPPLEVIEMLRTMNSPKGHVPCRGREVGGRKCPRGARGCGGGGGGATSGSSASRDADHAC